MVPSSASPWALSSQHLQADNLLKTLTFTLFSTYALVFHRTTPPPALHPFIKGQTCPHMVFGSKLTQLFGTYRDFYVVYFTTYSCLIYKSIWPSRYSVNSQQPVECRWDSNVHPSQHGEMPRIPPGRMDYVSELRDCISSNTSSQMRSIPPAHTSILCQVMRLWENGIQPSFIGVWIQ